jgi:hypothetical protein
MGFMDSPVGMNSGGQGWAREVMHSGINRRRRVARRDELREMRDEGTLAVKEGCFHKKTGIRAAAIRLRLPANIKRQGGAPRPKTRMSLRKCPYCEHPNSADAKFCVACGAIMHLAPCPHCGAVNDISSKQCYRCQGELPGAHVLDLPGETPPPVESVQPATAPDQPPSSRPSLMVVAVIALTFASAAYFAYRQKSVIVPPTATVPATEDASKAGKNTKAPESPPPAAPAAGAAPNSLAPPAAVPETAGVTPPAATAETARTPRERSSRARREAEAAAQAAAVPAGSSPAKRTPCTEAVAALGLCKPDAK